MSNHVTVEELAGLVGMTIGEVLRKCLELGVPVLHGRVDKTLFMKVLAADNQGNHA